MVFATIGVPRNATMGKAAVPARQSAKSDARIQHATQLAKRHVHHASRNAPGPAPIKAPAQCLVRHHAIDFPAISDALKILNAATSVQASVGKIVQTICVKSAATRVMLVLTSSK